MTQGFPDPWLTVITVVKDDAEGFTTTLESVTTQDTNGVEFLVIDSSTDAGEIPGILHHSPQPANYHWTAPTGIYPAMNHGLELASGTYVLFLNAGDSLYDNGVLADIRDHTVTQPIWLFGQACIVNAGGQHVLTPRWDYHEHQRHGFSHGKFPCHQATIARTASLRELGGFDRSYSIAADYAMFLRLSLLQDPIYIDRVIARFVEGGISTQCWQESFRQFHAARRAILPLTVRASAAERWGTWAHYASVFTYRTILRGGR